MTKKNILKIALGITVLLALVCALLDLLGAKGAVVNGIFAGAEVLLVCGVLTLVITPIVRKGERA